MVIDFLVERLAEIRVAQDGSCAVFHGLVVLVKILDAEIISIFILNTMNEDDFPASFESSRKKWVNHKTCGIRIA